LTSNQWIGGNNTSPPQSLNGWFFASNWSAVQVPTFNNAVTIDAPTLNQPVVRSQLPGTLFAQAGEITIGATNNASLTIESGGILTVANNVTVGSTGTVLVQQGGRLTIGGMGPGDAGTSGIIVNSALHGNGTVQTADGVTINPGGSLAPDGPGG